MIAEKTAVAVNWVVDTGETQAVPSDRLERGHDVDP
jgi:hypothetical protein